MGRVLVAAALAALCAGAAAASPRAGSSGALGQAGLVDVRTLDPSIRIDMRYAGKRNFTGRRLPGYCEERALLRRGPARALARVQSALEPRGLGLLVYDAYRPARASRAMVRWARRTGNGHLLNGWIAARSRHNAGVAVDLALVRLETGKRLRMGGPYDGFGRRSNTAAVGGKAGENRRRLVRAMAREGFANYWREWWHYEHRSGGRRSDVPIGC